MNGKKVLITGCSGFLGSNLASEVKKHAPKLVVYGTDRKGKDTDEYSFFEADLTDGKSAERLISEIVPDYIIHLAGAISTEDWETLYNANVKTTVSLLEAVKKSNSHPRVVVIGSAAEYGLVVREDLPVKEDLATKPASIYGASMCCRSTLCMTYARNGLDVSVGRAFNIIGPGVSEKLVIGSFAKQIADIKEGGSKGTLSTGRLDSQRDFLDVSDVSRALYILALNGISGGVYNICSGRSASIKECLDLMLRGLPHIKVATATDRLRQNDVSDVYGSNEKISTDTGWKQRISLEEGLRRTMDYYINKH